MVFSEGPNIFGPRVCPVTRRDRGSLLFGPMRRLLHLPLTAVLGAVACASPAPEPTPPSPTAHPSDPSAPTIDWQDWDLAAFERARDEHSLVLVDIGIEGCTACRWMDERTYRDPAVARRLVEHFVTIQVDAEARPDIGERYSAWGWPATIVMSPEGEQVLAIRGNKLPRNFIPILDRLIEAQDAGTLGADGEAPWSVPPEPDPAELGQLRRRVVAQLDRSYDDHGGGWGRRQKLPLGPNVAHALLRAHTRAPKPWGPRALHTLERYAGLLDPVWGGVFVGAIGEQWERIIPEKRIAGQAGALAGFAGAHHRTRASMWLDRAREVDRYVEAFMLAPDGGFYTSQEDDAPDLPDGLDAYGYYTTLDDQGRRAHGVPPVDHAIYTDKNGLMIAAYVDLYEASGEEMALTRARRAAESMLHRQHDDGLFVQHDPTQRLDDARMRDLPGGERRYLQAQGPMGLALLDLYRVTAEPRWLSSAERLAAGLRGLEDPEHGGFWSTDDPSMPAVAGRRKPLAANAMAARFLYELGVYTKDPSGAQRAERALRVVSAPAILRPEGRLVGELALALEWMTAGAVEISLLGDPAAAGTRALRSAALATYEPRKVLHVESSGRYPDPGHPVLYVCSDEVCSSPVADPARVADVVAGFGHNRAE